MLIVRVSSVIFLLHIALDVPIALQGLLSPLNLPFMGLNNTTVVFIKVRYTFLSWNTRIYVCAT